MFQGLNRRDVIECPLGNLMVVCLHIVHQRGFQLGCRGKARLMEYLADPAIETLDHAVGLRVTRWAQTMFDVQRFALHSELVKSAGPSFLIPESIRELAAIVREELDDFHGCGPLQAAQEVHAAVLALIWVDAHEHLACGSVDGNK